MQELTYRSIEFWGILVDAAGLFFCCIAVLYVLKERGWKSSKRKGKNQADEFNAEVFYQMMRQQFETSIAAITDVVNNEQKALQTLAHNRKGSAKSCLPEENRDRAKTLIDFSSSLEPEYVRTSGEVTRQGDLGFNTGRGSERVCMQREEIELIAKIERKRAGTM